jgi:predicted permease
VFDPNLAASPEEDRFSNPKGTVVMFRGIGPELRYVFRALRRSPAFSLVAIFSLAVGIGGNTAMFGVVKTLILTPLPVDTPQELALLTWSREGEYSINSNGSTSYRDPANGTSLRSNFSYPIYRAMVEGAPADVDVFAFAFLRGVSVGRGDQPAFMAGGAMVDGRYFSTLGVGLALGRPILESDDTPDAPLVAVLSHSFWMRTFGGDPEAIGQMIRVNGTPAEVIGVTAQGFTGLSMGGFFPQTEISIPLSSQPRVYPRMSSATSLFTSEDVFWLRLMARVPSGDRWGSTEQMLEATLRSYPSPIIGGDGYEPTLRLLPGDQGAQPIRPSTAKLLYFLLGVVGIVLLIACVNLAGLMLARGVGRQRELAVRKALGANRTQTVRQMLLEGLVLAVTGTTLGLGLAWASRGFLEGLLTGSLGSGAFGNVDMGVSLDPQVVALSAAIGITATLLFALFPALRLSGMDPNLWLKPRAAGAEGTPRLTAGRVLIALQISVSVPLVVGAALFLRTVANLGAVELGFDPKGVVSFQVDPGFTDLASQEYPELYLRLLSAVEELPGVRSATLMENALMSGISSNGRVTVEGQDHMLFRNAVGPALRETLGMRLLAGRMPGVQDTPDAPRVGALNETAVRELYGGEIPLGKILHLWNRDVQIIGVVNDTPYRSRREPVPATLYESALQRNGYGGHHIVLRTDRHVALLEPTIREAVFQVHPDLPVPEIRSQSTIMAQSSAKERVFTQLLTLFGSFALLLASIGLYGVTSYSVTRRKSEIGVRMAVGAQSGQIVWLILRQVVVLAGLGLLVGVPLSLAASPLVGSLLFGVAPTDFATVTMAAIVLLAVAGGAGLVPALRAARSDPLHSLRSE